jgi:glycosyltransferase involved in cell wall biosynthesis
MKILHIITGLNLSGAEKNLINLIEHSNNSDMKHSIVALRQSSGFSGSYGEFLMKKKLKKLSIDFVHENFKISTKSIIRILKLYKYILIQKPDIVCAWMYHSCIFSFVLYFFKPKNTKIIWNMRHTLGGYKKGEELKTKAIIYLSKLFSFVTNAIIYNSDQSLRDHKNWGFKSDWHKTINNGYIIEDLNLKKKKIESIELKKFLNVDIETKILVSVARFHPMKNHKSLIKSINKLIDNKKNKLHVLLIGKNINKKNNEILDFIGSYSDYYTLMGEVSDISSLLFKCDFYIQSSLFGESFPNALVEAILTGNICIATDLGSTSEIMNQNSEFVYNPKDDFKLNKYIEKALSLKEKDKNQILLSQFDYIKKHYDMNKTIENYKNFFLKICNE